VIAGEGGVGVGNTTSKQASFWLLTSKFKVAVGGQNMNATEEGSLLHSDKNDEEAGCDDSEIVNNGTRPSPIFVFFRLHNLVGVLSLFLMAFAQALPSPHEKLPIISFLQKFFILFACAVSVDADPFSSFNSF